MCMGVRVCMCAFVYVCECFNPEPPWRPDVTGGPVDCKSTRPDWRLGFSSQILVAKSVT